MYEFSLANYIQVFIQSMKNAVRPIPRERETRIANILRQFKLDIFSLVNKSLFVKHKLIFSFLLAMADLNSRGHFFEMEWKILLTGLSNTTILETSPNPLEETISTTAWESIHHIALLK